MVSQTVPVLSCRCGPCKIIYPKLVALSLERTDVRFTKFNCNKANKDLGQKLAIKVSHFVSYAVYHSNYKTYLSAS